MTIFSDHSPMMSRKKQGTRPPVKSWAAVPDGGAFDPPGDEDAEEHFVGDQAHGKAEGMKLPPHETVTGQHQQPRDGRADPWLPTLSTNSILASGSAARSVRIRSARWPLATVSASRREERSCGAGAGRWPVQSPCNPLYRLLAAEEDHAPHSDAQ